jgi:hypothetical protein
MNYCNHADKRDTYLWINSFGHEWMLCPACLKRMEAAKARAAAFMKANPDYAAVPGTGTDE